MSTWPDAVVIILRIELPATIIGTLIALSQT